MEVLDSIKIVCISDTHGRHRDLVIPEADILIHAGDFTHFGKEPQAIDFNEWLGSLPHKHKIVVNGNHESNAPWKNKTAGMLSNAHFLNQQEVRITVRSRELKIFGTQFFWPCPSGNPYFDQIPEGTDVVIAHGPAQGYVDGQGMKLEGGGGCPSLLQRVRAIRPTLVVCGHIHSAHGVKQGEEELHKTTFVNAAQCKDGYSIGWTPIVVSI